MSRVSQSLKLSSEAKSGRLGNLFLSNAGFRSDVAISFVILGAISVALFLVAMHYIQQQERSRRFVELQFAEEGIVLSQSAIIRNKLTLLRSDIMFLRNEYESLLAKIPDDRAMVDTFAAEEFINFMKTRNSYDQVRILDVEGAETVRINYNGGAPIRVADDRLQDKSNRPYVQGAFNADRDQISVSRIDLNVEDGKVIRPIKPTIRVATSIVDKDGEMVGIIVLNYRVGGLLQEIEAASDLAIGAPIAINADGYFLLPYGSVPTWGFMLPSTEPDQFSELYPLTWEAIQGTTEGEVMTDEGLFVYRVVDPIGDLLVSTSVFEGFAPPGRRARIEDPKRILYVGTFVSAERVERAISEPSSASNIYGAFIVALCLTGSAIAAISLGSARQHRRALEHLARFDTLTGLANRQFLEDRLDEEVQRATRSGHMIAVAFLDIDGFKAINDNLGHAVGDRALIDIADTIESLVRSCDLVVRNNAPGSSAAQPFSARIGGDEFVVILPEIRRLDDVEPILRRLEDGICALSWDDYRVGVSIGLSVYPQHGTSRKELLHAADNAMYVAKRSDDGGIVFASGVPTDDIGPKGPPPRSS